MITHKQARWAYARAYQRPTRFAGLWLVKPTSRSRYWLEQTYSYALDVAKCLAVNEAVRTLCEQEGLDDCSSLALEETLGDSRSGPVIARAHIINWLGELAAN